MKKLKRIISVILIIILVGGVYFMVKDKYLIENNTSISDNKEQTSNEGKEETSNIENSSQTEIPLKENTSSNDKVYPALEVPNGTVIDRGTTSKGYSIKEIDGVTYIDGIMIVNKTYGLPSTFIPTDTKVSCIGQTNTCNKCINNTAYNAFNDMAADASTIGLNLYISSGYRSYDKQVQLYDRYKARDGKEAADTYSARPGYSEHQSSLAFDINIINDTFINTDEGKWVNNNAYLYGFVIRFPKGKQDYTGYKYESWHLRYVGTELAIKLYNNGDWLSLEEYFGIESKYVD